MRVCRSLVTTSMALGEVATGPGLLPGFLGLGLQFLEAGVAEHLKATAVAAGDVGEVLGVALLGRGGAGGEEDVEGVAFGDEGALQAGHVEDLIVPGRPRAADGAGGVLDGAAAFPSPAGLVQGDVVAFAAEAALHGAAKDLPGVADDDGGLALGDDGAVGGVEFAAGLAVGGVAGVADGLGVEALGFQPAEKRLASFLIGFEATLPLG